MNLVFEKDEWMPLEQYAEITKEKPNNVHARVSLGIWQRGKHVSAPDGGKVWVNIKAVLEWITSKDRPAKEKSDDQQPD